MPKVFTGSNDGITTETQKKNMRKILLAWMLHWCRYKRFVSFSFQGEAGQWWDTIQSDEEKLNGTWDQFDVAFDYQYVLETIR